MATDEVKDEVKDEVSGLVRVKPLTREAIINRDLGSSLDAMQMIAMHMRDLPSPRARILAIAFFVAEFDPVAAGTLYGLAAVYLGDELAKDAIERANGHQK